jgi:MFS family permease
LAVIVGLSSLIAGAFLYEMGKLIYHSWDKHNNGWEIIKNFAPPEIKNYAPLSYDDQIAGCLAGALLSLLPAAIVYNPLAAFYKAFRKFWREELSWNKISKLGRMLIAPLQGPLQGIFYQGIYKQGERGWYKGFFKIAKSPLKVVKAGPQMRDVIASLIVASLIIGVVLSVIFPPLNIAWLVPSLLAAVGLSGLSTWIIAVVAGAATFMLASILYGIGSQIYDFAIKVPALQNTYAASNGQKHSFTKTTGLFSTESPANSVIDTADPKITAKQSTFSGFSKIFSSVCLSGRNHQAVQDIPLDEKQVVKKGL